jgi:aromatic-L-amino-acid decarboxylase
MQHAMATAMAWLAPWAEALSEAPSRTFHPVAFDAAMPPHPQDVGAVFQSLHQAILENSVNSAGPTYQAYIPGGGLFTAALGEFIAALTNRYVGVHDLAPTAVALEAAVLRWFCDLVGYPTEARGILTSGGSLANFSASSGRSARSSRSLGC